MYDNQEPKEEAVSCAKCDQMPNDVLILTCDHNLCLRCASLNLQSENNKNNMSGNANEKSNGNSFQTVICEICQIATVLDPASATELLTMSHEPSNNGQDDNFGENSEIGY
mgnify:CR=1 FL=1|tara:strand:+ start:79 stop:411 length:333 start_codon:yes stop_codon:yes gene_type:complete